MDPVDRLIVDESPDHARRLVVLDAPDLVEEARRVADEVVVWCDDARDRAAVPEELRGGDLTADLFAGADLVWLRLPKSLGALDEYAELAAQGMAEDGRLVAGGRVKHMTHSMNEVLASHFGGVNASLGRQKSRVLHATIPMAADLTWPRSRTHRDENLTLWTHGATFAGAKIDIGTRVLLRHLDEVSGHDVLDLGSGNGVIATVLARLDRSRHVLASDVSWAAARATALTAKENRVDVEARWATDLDDLPSASLDAVVTNPPFHKGAAKQSDDAERIFTQSARLLRPGGEFWCVFNSHLPWKARLTALVGPTKVVEQTTGFTVTRSIRRDDVSGTDRA